MKERLVSRKVMMALSAAAVIGLATIGVSRSQQQEHGRLYGNHAIFEKNDGSSFRLLEADNTEIVFPGKFKSIVDKGDYFVIGRKLPKGSVAQCSITVIQPSSGLVVTINEDGVKASQTLSISPEGIYYYTETGDPKTVSYKLFNTQTNRSTMIYIATTSSYMGSNYHDSPC